MGQCSLLLGMLKQGRLAPEHKLLLGPLPGTC